MKNTLAENMLRFGSKNLDAKSVKKLQKLAEQGTPVPGADAGQINPAQAGASVPKSIVLNYDNGMLRVGGGGNWDRTNGDYRWNVQVTLIGTPGKLTFSKVDFIPVGRALAKEGLKAVSVPTVTPVAITIPIDFNQEGNATTLIPVKLKNDANFAAVMAGLPSSAMGPDYALDSISTDLGPAIWTALANVCAQNGWYTGPKQPVAKQYAIFVNHTGVQNLNS
jgi:hypothetical protein